MEGEVQYIWRQQGFQILGTLAITVREPDIDIMRLKASECFPFVLDVRLSFLFCKLERESEGKKEKLQLVQNNCDVLDLLSYMLPVTRWLITLTS